MIIGQECTCEIDHFAYHITEKQNIDSIIRYGLLPTIGDRSIIAGDNFKAVFFFDNINNIEEWMDFLYKNKDKDSLDVLRFNIKSLKWFIHNNGEEFYIRHKIPITKIDYLEIYNKESNLISYNNLINENIYNLEYRWNKLKEYHKRRNS